MQRTMAVIRLNIANYNKTTEIIFHTKKTGYLKPNLKIKPLFFINLIFKNRFLDFMQLIEITIFLLKIL